LEAAILCGVFDHVAIRASDRDASEAFYRLVLGTLEIPPPTTDDSSGLLAWNDFWILPTVDAKALPTRHLHVAFVAPSRAHVDRFHAAGVDAGHADAGMPGERPQYRPGYYGAFLRDPDGNSVEAVHHGDTRRGGHIDHLWIGVDELAGAEEFYRLIARHVGLREGRRWKHGVQFRGAWATLSLVSDSRPVTQQLQLAFPAPDRTAVEEFHRAATASGYRSAGEPGERTSCNSHPYGARVLDPDGTSVESVHRGRRCS
jgi:catechol 2,3-dioxygenase-like lactoylglutathione lyase family enzyme